MRYFLDHLSFRYAWFRLRDYVRMLAFECRHFTVPHLGLLSVQVVDHCNLNCKGCSAYSPLAKEWYADVVQIQKDLLELAKKVQFGQIVLIGGETLLHPQLTELVQIVKRIYPKASVVITTNGILLPKMSDDFWKVCNEERVLIIVSVYPPYQEKMSTYVELARKNKVSVLPIFSSDVWKLLKNSPMGSGYSADKIFRKCPLKTCHRLYHSKLYLCQMCFLEHYNRYFNENHETVKGYDIYKYSGKELVEFMKRPDPACRYCTWVMKNETTQWDYSKREKSEWCGDV